MFKKVIYFILSILAILYFATLVCFALDIVTPEILGGFADVLAIFQTYGGVVLVFLYACTNFTGNIFKILLFILLVVVAIIFVLVQFEPIKDFFKGILGLAV